MNTDRILSPDFGHIFQGIETPQPIDYILTPAERDTAKLGSLELERKKREANKRDEDREIVKLGVVFTDPKTAA